MVSRRLVVTGIALLVASSIAVLRVRSSSEPETEEATGVASVEVDVASACTRSVEALLASDVQAMLLGRPDTGVDVRGRLVRLYGANSPTMARVDRVRFHVLTTAVGDLLGPYHRNGAALRAAYAPRIAMDCQQP